jgi:cell division protein FtsQ
MAHVLAGVDPRIRARRVAVRRAEGRRRLQFLVSAVAVVVACVGAWGLTRTPLLDLDRVRVEGVTSGSTDDIDAAIGAVGGVPLMDVDINGIETRLETLPWVETAAVRRDWPGTLRIDIVERVPAALIPAGADSFAVLDIASVVIGTSPIASAPDLPVVQVDLEVAPGETQMSATPGLAVVTSLPADLRPWVERIRIHAGERTTLSTELTGSAIATLGDTSLLGDKLEALRAVLAGVDLACIDEIDVAVADFPTVTSHPECDRGATPNSG